MFRSTVSAENVRSDDDLARKLFETPVLPEGDIERDEA